MIKIYSANRFRGVSLVELMIAMAISAVLLIGVVTIYNNTKRTYVAGEEFAVLQENGRMALQFLVHDIRMAGFMGCAWNTGEDAKFQCYLDNTGDSNFICDNIAVGITGYEAADPNTSTTSQLEITTSTSNPNSTLLTGARSAWSNSSIAQLPNSFPLTTAPIVGSDIIVVRYGADNGIKITDNKESANFRITGTLSGDCETTSGICAGDVLIASDCQQARVFQATTLEGVSGSTDIKINHDRRGTVEPGNAPAHVSWGGASDPDNDFSKDDTEILNFRTFAYFVANNPNGQPALYRHDGINNVSHPAEELVEGVENMQILYGVDTNADGVANYYAPANTLPFTTSANPIVAVRISLLVRTNNELPNRPRISDTYTMASTDVVNDTADGRLRKIYTTTIKIRNKGL